MTTVGWRTFDGEVHYRFRHGRPDVVAAAPATVLGRVRNRVQASASGPVVHAPYQRAADRFEVVLKPFRGQVLGQYRISKNRK